MTEGGSEGVEGRERKGGREGGREGKKEGGDITSQLYLTVYMYM